MALLFEGGVEPVGAANDEGDVLAFTPPTLHRLGQLGGTPVAATLIKGNALHLRRQHLLESPCFGLHDLRRGAAAAARFRLDFTQLQAKLGGHASCVIAKTGRYPVGHFVPYCRNDELHASKQPQLASGVDGDASFTRTGLPPQTSSSA